MKRLIAAPLLATAAAGGVAAPALASATYATKVTVAHSTQGGGGFVGYVKSSAAACVPNRKVTVYRVQPGADPAIGYGWSLSNGKWWFTKKSLAAGDYYAKTPAVTRKGKTCQAGRSITTHAS